MRISYYLSLLVYEHFSFALQLWLEIQYLDVLYTWFNSFYVQQSRDFAIEFRKVPYALLIKKRNHGNSLKRRDLLARNSTRFICTNLGRIRSLDFSTWCKWISCIQFAPSTSCIHLVHSVPINLFWENSLDFFRLEVRKDTIFDFFWANQAVYGNL